ncbi:T9SS type A sorting domain-containing protein [Rubrivirga sp.]|uniref:T9SS type A sorting domain-containing protein n=1 Tax=Rubrivirga sp. TaxID=1885344 RepID=UPI003B519DB8
MRTATRLGLLAALVTLLVPQASAQFGRAAGDNFVFFSEGLNFRLTLEGSRTYFRTVEDPIGEEGMVAEYDFFNDSRTLGFRFSGGREGISFLDNVTEGDTLFFKFRAEPVHAGQGDDNFTLRFEDRFGSLGNVSDGNNVPFRLDWTFPDSLLDGTWHDLAIPLPPQTYNELQAIKDGANPDPFTANWEYSGSTGGVDGAVDPEGPIGTDGLGPNTNERPQFWREFEWSNVYNVGTYWPVDPSGDGSATVWFDDFYIGNSDVDLADLRDAPEVYAAPLTPAVSDNVVTLDLVQDPAYVAYRAYFSGSPISGVPATAADSMNVIATSIIEPRLFPTLDPTDAEDVAARYVALRPHPNVGDETVDLYYGVSTFNLFGEETMTLATGGPVQVTRETRPWIFEVSADAADDIIGDLADGDVDPAALELSGRRPFQLGVGEGTGFNFGDPEVAGDASANVWVAFAEDSEDEDNTLFIVYAEVEDDILIAGQDADQDGRFDGTGNQEKYDSIFMRFGGYEIEDGIASGGNLFPEVGTDRPDYVVFFQLLRDNPDDTSQRMVTGVDMFSGSDPIGEIVSPAVEVTATGYRFMAVFGASEIVRDGEDVFERPASNEISLIPFSLNLQDQDFDNVFSTSNRTLYYDTDRGDINGAYGQIFATPLQWPAVALVGSDVVAVAEEGGPADDGFRLGQSHPNPVASGTASVSFDLPESAPVSLTVYNVLGQEVLRVMDREDRRAGPHTVRVDVSGLAAGLYVYRLNAGDRTATSRMVVVR